MKNNISTRLIEILVPTYGGGVVDDTVKIFLSF